MTQLAFRRQINFSGFFYVSFPFSFTAINPKSVVVLCGSATLSDDIATFIFLGWWG